MTKARKPAAFRLDDPGVTVVARDPAETALPHAPRGRIVVKPEPDTEPLPATAGPAPATRKRRWPWGALFWSALGGLLSLGVGLWVTQLIEDLYARAPWLGSIGLALAILAALALLVLITREAIGLMRLRAVEHVRARAEDAAAQDDRDAARGVVRELLVILRAKPALARGRAELGTHLDEIIDGADLLRLAERELLTPLDRDARRLVSNAAKRVSVVTAVSPRAAVDIVFVFITAVMLIRRLADLYGGRPGALGMIRLVRHVIAHLAVTGGMAVGDSLVQQVVGHGVAARLSARLGEGVLNGLLTARLGLAAIEVTRPLPFLALPPPSISDLAGDLLRKREPAASGENTGSS